MNKHIISVIAALGLMASSALAVEDTHKPAPHDAPPPPPHGDEMPPHPMRGKEWTLQEARQHAHEHADKLDKMTEEEWSEKQKKRREHFEKMDKMSPQEKEAYYKNKAEKREQYLKNKQESDKPMPADASKPAK